MSRGKEKRRSEEEPEREDFLLLDVLARHVKGTVYSEGNVMR
jgi:hypothetical protein